MTGDARNLSNVGIKGRFKQVLILVVAILVGVIISCAAEAQDFHKAKKRHFKARYREQLSHGNSCELLGSKNTVSHRRPLFTSLHRKPKTQAQAEVDSPATAEARSPKFRRANPLMARK